MDNCLLVNINLFSLNHSIILLKEDSAHSFGLFSYEDLPKAIINYSKDYEAYKVKIAGGKAYAEGLIAGIKEEEIKVYNSNKLEIEVI